MSDPKIIMISTGQFLIGHLEFKEGVAFLTDPFEIMIQPTADEMGNMVPQVGMFPFCLMSKDRTFTFDVSSILTGPQEPDEQCRSHYLKSTSKITIPTPAEQSILLG